jgi:hypothetical protein
LYSLRYNHFFIAQIAIACVQVGYDYFCGDAVRGSADDGRLWLNTRKGKNVAQANAGFYFVRASETTVSMFTRMIAVRSATAAM